LAAGAIKASAAHHARRFRFLSRTAARRRVACRRSSPIATSQARREGPEPGEGLLLKRVVARFFGVHLWVRLGSVNLQAAYLVRNIVSKSLILWWVHKDSNLGPAD
jgi:hypothetical protein